MKTTQLVTTALVPASPKGLCRVPWTPKAGCLQESSAVYVCSFTLSNLWLKYHIGVLHSLLEMKYMLFPMSGNYLIC